MAWSRLHTEAAKVSPKGYQRGRVTFDGGYIDVVAPRTEALLERGLQRYSPIRLGEGMVFLSEHFPGESAIPMWIADVRVPLTMVWIGGRGVVTHIEHAVDPTDKRTFTHVAALVLEMHPAEAEALRLRPGRPVQVEFFP